MILMAYFFRHSNFEVAIPLSCALLGTFALGESKFIDSRNFFTSQNFEIGIPKLLIKISF